MSKIMIPISETVKPGPFPALTNLVGSARFPDPSRSWRGGVRDGILHVLRGQPDFQHLEILLAMPRNAPSSTDDAALWVLARCDAGLISIAVEPKGAEPFGPKLGDWRVSASAGKHVGLKYLGSVLGLSLPLPDDVPYQLLERSASAVMEAKRFFAGYAVLLVHSLGSEENGFADFARFVSLFGAEARVNRIIQAEIRCSMPLYFAWVNDSGAETDEGFGGPEAVVAH